jgi:hypothetical protein
MPAGGGHACCDAAIAAMVADVGVTANVAMTALVALARRYGHAPGVVPPGTTP